MFPNGVDFIISETGPVVIEVNARFQGSLDTVEMSTGINLVDAHVKAFNNVLVPVNDRGTYSGRAILYADRELIVTENTLKKLSGINICDIEPRTAINPMEPVMSVLCSGHDREDVLIKLEESVMFIRESLNLLDS
ncbi:MAG: ATP-grasp domain-containing protein [Methanolobus sp.]